MPSDLRFFGKFENLFAKRFSRKNPLLNYNLACNLLLLLIINKKSLIYVIYLSKSGFTKCDKYGIMIMYENLLNERRQ